MPSRTNELHVQACKTTMFPAAIAELTFHIFISEGGVPRHDGGNNTLWLAYRHDAIVSSGYRHGLGFQALNLSLKSAREAHEQLSG